MERIKEFLKTKSIGFYFLLATVLLLLLGLIFFSVLFNVSVEGDEQPALILTLTILSILLLLLSAYKDFFHVPSLIAFVLTTIVLFVFITGRVSYLAYYFTGDIQGTGLSPFFILSFVFFLLAYVGTICSVVLKKTK